MLIELGAFLFGDRYESTYEHMKKDPTSFKRKLASFFEKEAAAKPTILEPTNLERL